MNTYKYVVTADEIKAMQGREKTHFLNDNAVRINKSLGDLTGLTGIGVNIIEVEPGRDTTEFHVHYHEDIFRNQGLAWILVDHPNLEEPVAGAKE